MSRKKADTFYWRIAKRNLKMSNDIYKAMIKNSTLIPKNISISSFKEAYHSPYTTDDHRALLLTSLYTKDPTLIEELLSHSPELRNQRLIQPRFAINTKNGSKYFQLSGVNMLKVKLTPIKINSMMKKEIRSWKPWADKNHLLTRTLVSGNAQQQKAALLIGEAAKIIYATADLLRINIRANDPFKAFLGDSPIKEKNKAKTLDNSRVVGDYKSNETKFKTHLYHMANQFSKYLPIFNKLGIDTMEFEMTFGQLISKTETFLNNKYLDENSELNALYEIHETARDTLSEVLLLAIGVENIDLNSQNIYALGRLENIPIFVDYKPEKLEKHSTVVNESVVDKVREIILLFKR